MIHVTHFIRSELDDEILNFVAIETFFEDVENDNAMNAFKSLVKSDNLSDTCRNAYELIQLLRLGKIEQGSVSSAANFKSLNARWFGVKATMKKTEDTTIGENSHYIERDSLVKMKYKRGGNEVIRFY